MRPDERHDEAGDEAGGNVDLGATDYHHPGVTADPDPSPPIEDKHQRDDEERWREDVT